MHPALAAPVPPLTRWRPQYGHPNTLLFPSLQLAARHVQHAPAPRQLDPSLFAARFHGPRERLAQRLCQGGHQHPDQPHFLVRGPLGASEWAGASCAHTGSVEWAGWVFAQICKARGFICEFCHSDEIMYPFQLRAVVQCASCKSFFHRKCYVASRCPKCLRLEAQRLRYVRWRWASWGSARWGSTWWTGTGMGMDEVNGVGRGGRAHPKLCVAVRATGPSRKQAANGEVFSFELQVRCIGTYHIL